MKTLFLDRDGVINQRIPGEYVHTPEAFVPTEGMVEALRLLADSFPRIVVVTNQQGIGKGRMSEADLAAVHQKMKAMIAAGGGRIDAVYHCPHLASEGCFCRKPATGMAWMALQDLPDLSLEDAWMAGDSASDMEFARRLGIRKVLILGKEDEQNQLKNLEVDFSFDSLLDFARFIAT